MTREQATELVFDLINAVRVHERGGDRYTLKDLEDMRAKLIDALSASTASLMRPQR
jgi:hypothetical protein